MTSTLKADVLQSKTTNGDLTISGDGSGVPNLEAGFKVAGTAGVPVSALRAGTDGELITWDASGVAATVGVGSATNVLTSNGAGAAPTFQAAAGGGAWTLIGTSVASNSATLDQTGLDSTYDTFAIAFSDILPATDQVAPRLRLGDSGGVDSGGTDYGYHMAAFLSASNTYNGSGSTGADHILMRASENVGNATGEGFGGLIYLSRPGDGTTQPGVHGTCFWWNNDSPTRAVGGLISGGRKAVITLDRIQFSFSIGNITSGRMTVWGIKHA